MGLPADSFTTSELVSAVYFLKTLIPGVGCLVPQLGLPETQEKNLPF